MKKVLITFALIFCCSGVFAQNTLDSLKLKVYISDEIIFVTDSLKKPCFTEKVYAGLKNAKVKLKKSGIMLVNSAAEADTTVQLRFEVEDMKAFKQINLNPDYGRTIGFHLGYELCQGLKGFEEYPEYLFYGYFSFNDIAKDTTTKKDEIVYSPLSILLKTQKQQDPIANLILNRTYNHFLGNFTHYPYLGKEKNSPVVTIHTKTEKKTGNTIFTLEFSYYGEKEKFFAYENPTEKIYVQKIFKLKKNFTKKEFYTLSYHINDNIEKCLKINNL